MDDISAAADETEDDVRLEPSELGEDEDGDEESVVSPSSKSSDESSASEYLSLVGERRVRGGRLFEAGISAYRGSAGRSVSRGRRRFKDKRPIQATETYSSRVEAVVSQGTWERRQRRLTRRPGKIDSVYPLMGPPSPGGQCGTSFCVSGSRG